MGSTGTVCHSTAVDDYAAELVSGGNQGYYQAFLIHGKSISSNLVLARPVSVITWRRLVSAG